MYPSSMIYEPHYAQPRLTQGRQVTVRERTDGNGCLCATFCNLESSLSEHNRKSSTLHSAKRLDRLSILPTVCDRFLARVTTYFLALNDFANERPTHWADFRWSHWVESRLVVRHPVYSKAT